MIYDDKLSNNNYQNIIYNNNVDNEAQQYYNVDKEENEDQEENIRENKILLIKMHKKEENDINPNSRNYIEKRGKKVQIFVIVKKEIIIILYKIKV